MLFTLAINRNICLKIKSVEIQKMGDWLDKNAKSKVIMNEIYHNKLLNI